MWGRTGYRFDADGKRHAVHAFADDDPGGLGWLPDGRLLVVGMERRVVYRLEARGPVVHADLAELAPWPCSDRIVADDGTLFAQTAPAAGEQYAPPDGICLDDVDVPGAGRP
jgi:hypothetical protein